MIATVLIGDAPTHGVIARIHNLPNPAGEGILHRLQSETVRGHATKTWPFLDQALVPTVSGEQPEQVFKVARYRFEGVWWTWIGVYFAAQFAGTNRTGSFVGAGVLSDSLMPADRALAYITTLADQINLLARNGVIAHNVDQFVQAGVCVYAQPFRENGAVQAGAGLTAVETRYVAAGPRVYLDLSDHYTKEEFDPRLVSLVEQAQTSPVFADVSMMAIGNAKALASRAKGAGYKVFTAEQWDERRGATWASRQAAAASAERVDPISTPAAATVGDPRAHLASGAGTFKEGQRAEFDVKVSLRRIEDTLSRVEDVIRWRAEAETKPRPVWAWLGWGALAATAVAAFLGLSGAPLPWKDKAYQPTDRGVETDVSEGKAEGDVERQATTSPVATQSAVTPCPIAEVAMSGALETADRRLAGDEISCLEQARTDAQRRINELKGRMAPTAAATSVTKRTSVTRKTTAARNPGRTGRGDANNNKNSVAAPPEKVVAPTPSN